MPAHKKHASTRARRNKTPGAATLPARPLTVVADPVDYSTLKIAELRALVDERNADGRTESKMLSKAGSKAAIVARLREDDARADGPPELPERADGWHPQTEAWWRDVWSSPMHNEWDESDLHNLYLCAALYDDMWRATTPKARKDAAGEFRLQRASLGLDPYARRRLEWQIEVTEGEKDKGEQRRTRRAEQQGASGQAAKSSGRKDPRSALRAAK